MHNEKSILDLSKYGIPPGARIAAAVSGGGDSMALALLLRQAGYAVLALTVDHGLRAGSAAEAQGVAAFFAAEKIPHRILTWEGDKPKTHIQERAREARYDLLLRACRAEGCDVLALGHNAEDQIETFWMRLAHGSGLDGLAAMAPVREVENIKMIRPLLGFSRDRLRQVCRDFGAPYVDDPSNEDSKFLRVRLRQFEETLKQEGLSPARLAQTVQKLDAARAALQWAARQALAACATWQNGEALIDRATWLTYPDDLRGRVVTAVMQQLTPQKYPPDWEALQRLCADMARPEFSGRTLGGCQFAPRKNGVLSVIPEKSAFPKD